MSSCGSITTEPIAFASMGSYLKAKYNDQTIGELEPSSEEKSGLRELGDVMSC